jgi:hypothetical protein
VVFVISLEEFIPVRERRKLERIRDYPIMGRAADDHDGRLEGRDRKFAILQPVNPRPSFDPSGFQPRFGAAQTAKGELE